MKTPTSLLAIISNLIKHKLTPIIVGGWVRDQLLGIQCKDIDIEVFGDTTLEELKSHLSDFGPVNVVGAQFQVLKLKIEDMEVDISLPRRDVKTGSGHRGFEITADPQMTFKQAAVRRDFTINAMGYNPQTEEILDPFNGQNDLKNRVLKHTSPAFSEDPLRVLRAMQFAARFELTIHPDTITLCRQQNLTELSRDRITDEFKKLLLKAARPSLGLKLINTLGINTLVPNLMAHTKSWEDKCQFIDTLAHDSLHMKADERFPLLLAALCYDMTQDIAKKCLRQFTANNTLIRKVCQLINPLPRPILSGKDFIKYGVKEGKEIGDWLKKGYEAQLNGEFSNHHMAQNWVSKLFKG